MRDFVRDYWKIAAAFAAGAFLLSFLVGLVTRNPFGVVILRALLLTVIFAALGAGIRFVIRKYLPELAAGEGARSGNAPSPAAETRGTKIDITLPEERPEGSRGVRSRESGRRAPGPGVPAGASPGAAEGLEGAGDEEIVQRAEAEALDELAEELAEELPAASDAGPAHEGETGDAGYEEQEAEELRPLGGDREPGSLGGADAGEEEEGGLDSLPDISNLEIAGEQGSGSPRSGRGPGGETPSDSMRGAVSGQDPATMARAIRTVVKRDEKG